MSPSEMPHAPAAALNTSEGGRRYVADFFARELRRNDFTRYITTTLAADFACALAQHLAARQPGAQATHAQGIDLGQQQDAARWRAIAPLLSVEWDEDEQLKRWTWIDFKGDAPAIPSPTRQEYASVDEAVDALISQRDAAPGVGA